MAKKKGLSKRTKNKMKKAAKSAGIGLGKAFIMFVAMVFAAAMAMK